MELWTRQVARRAGFALCLLVAGWLAGTPLLAQTAPAQAPKPGATTAQPPPESVPIALPGAGSSIKNPAVALPDLPEDADVFINGSLQGKGLKRVEVILPGTYELMVRRKGFRPWTKSVTLQDAQTLQVQAEFIPLKMAIFPVDRGGVVPAGMSVPTLMVRTTNALGQAANTAGINVTHSVHRVAQRSSAQFGEDLGSVPRLEQDSRGLTGRANVAYALRKGKELGVDAVLYFNSNLGSSSSTLAPEANGTWTAQLIDVPTGTVLEDSGTWSTGANLERDISSQVGKLLDRYTSSLVRSSGKQTMVVLDLEGEEADPGAVHAIGESLREELANTGRYTVMPRSEEATILDRLAPKQTTCTAVECALQAGKLFGVQKVVAGRVTGLSSSSWKVSVIQVDVATGETISSESIRHSGSLNSAGRSLAPLADDLAVAASPQGTVFRYEQSKWRWKTGLVMGSVVVLGLATGYFAQEVKASNDRQKDDRIKAEAATTQAEFSRWSKKLDDEKARGTSLRNQAIVAEIGAGALLWWGWSVWRSPPELPPVAWQVLPTTPDDRGVGMSIAYRW